MNLSVWEIIIIPLLLSIPSIIDLLIKARGMQHTQQKDDSEFVKNVLEASGIAAEQYKKVMEQLKVQNEEISMLKLTSEKRDKEVAELKTELTDVHDWAKRLVQQVKELGGVPVPLIRRSAD
jgi:hypothetical protein